MTHGNPPSVSLQMLFQDVCRSGAGEHVHLRHFFHFFVLRHFSYFFVLWIGMCASKRGVCTLTNCTFFFRCVCVRGHKGYMDLSSIFAFYYYFFFFVKLEGRSGIVLFSVIFISLDVCAREAHSSYKFSFTLFLRVSSASHPFEQMRDIREKKETVICTKYFYCVGKLLFFALHDAPHHPLFFVIQCPVPCVRR